MLKIRKKSLDNIFLDTDAVVALARLDDTNHKKAELLQNYLDEVKANIYTSDFVVGEIVTVLSQSLGVAKAVEVGEQIMDGDIRIIYVTNKHMRIALEKFSKQTSKNSRFTDVVNMIMMDELKIDTIFSFDKHYLKNGYKLLI